MSFLDNLAANLPIGKKKDTEEYFFALNIGLSEVTAVVWGILNHKLDILGQHTISYQDTDDLLEKANIALDRALGAFEIEPKKILFGVPGSWSLDDNLKEPYLKLLRKMVKEYELEPMAYVAHPQSISHFLEKKDGVPPTAVLIGLGDFIEVTLLRGGKVAEDRIVKRGDHLFEDLEKGLLQFTDVEVLPSKIILYRTKVAENLDKIRDELMTYPWMSKLPFLHFPKIEVLEEELQIFATIFAGASELDTNLDLRHSLGMKKTLPVEGKQHASLKETPQEENLIEEDFGFVKGDIKHHKDLSGEVGEPLVSANNEEVRKFRRLTSSEIDDLNSDNLVSPNIPESFGEDLTPNFTGHTKGYSPQLPGHHQELGALEKFNPQINRLKKLLPTIKIPKLGGGISTKLFLGLGGLLLIVFAYIFLVKAEVVVFVEPKILENSAEIIADPKISAIDEEKRIIPGEIVETSVSGSSTGTATGQKQIGNAAKGKVVIYNLTNAKISLSQGTVMTGDGRKFTLDTLVQIASQSSSIGSDLTTLIKPGKSDAVPVTAQVIGPESNLSAGTDLTVTGYTKSQVVARVDEALSGGTSKNVTVVTSDDQKKLQAKLVNELRQKAQEQLQQVVPSEKKIVPEALAAAEGKYSFNKQVNDQAAEFTLNATVKFKGTAYSDTDLRTIVSKLVGTNIPNNFELNLQGMETQADVSKLEKDGRLIFSAKFRAKLMPRLDTEDLKNQLKGKGVLEAIESLKTVENVIGAEIKLVPSLPEKFARVSLLNQNISILITPK